MLLAAGVLLLAVLVCARWAFNSARRALVAANRACKKQGAIGRLTVVERTCVRMCVYKHGA